MKYPARLFCAAISLCAFASGEAAPAPAAQRCERVTATYAIFTNDDALRIAGSKHYLIANSDDLDTRLEAVGWEQHAVIGQFLLCGPRLRAVKDWSIRDSIRLESFTATKIVKRTFRVWL